MHVVQLQPATRSPRKYMAHYLWHICGISRLPSHRVQVRGNNNASASSASYICFSSWLSSRNDYGCVYLDRYTPKMAIFKRKQLETGDSPVEYQWDLGMPYFHANHSILPRRSASLEPNPRDLDTMNSRHPQRRFPRNL